MQRGRAISVTATMMMTAIATVGMIMRGMTISGMTMTGMTTTEIGITTIRITLLGITAKARATATGPEKSKGTALTVITEMTGNAPMRNADAAAAILDRPAVVHASVGRGSV